MPGAAGRQTPACNVRCLCLCAAVVACSAQHVGCQLAKVQPRWVGEDRALAWAACRGQSPIKSTAHVSTGPAHRLELRTEAQAQPPAIYARPVTLVGPMLFGLGQLGAAFQARCPPPPQEGMVVWLPPSARQGRCCPAPHLGLPLALLQEKDVFPPAATTALLLRLNTVWRRRVDTRQQPPAATGASRRQVQQAPASGGIRALLLLSVRAPAIEVRSPHELSTARTHAA